MGRPWGSPPVRPTEAAASGSTFLGGGFAHRCPPPCLHLFPGWEKGGRGKGDGRRMGGQEAGSPSGKEGLGLALDGPHLKAVLVAFPETSTLLK